jgi:TolA-binding protein
VDALLARLNALPVAALDAASAKLLSTELLFLKARVQIGGGDTSGGLAVLQQIRSESEGSSAAQHSYLIEADYQASIGDLKATQATLSLLASTYPASVLAPQAIFEAALYCERRGPDFYGEAVRLHNDIAVRYPQDELVFSARLKQGDILRKMNDFAGAQLVYENVINAYPRHPRRFMAELSRADCMLALAQGNESQLVDVILSLERIIDTPNLPVNFQAEAGYKWGFALSKRGKVAEAKEVYTLMIGALLLDQDGAARLGASGRYWGSRMLLALADILEAEGEFNEARRVYRKMVAFNLPGRNLAQGRAERLQIDAPSEAE